MRTFNEWMSGVTPARPKIEESTDQTIWERHKKLPSIFTRTYYALPTNEQVAEFEEYPDLSADDIVQGFGYTIVGRGVSSPDNCKKIVASISKLVNHYPDNGVYKEALAKAEEEAKIKIEKWHNGVMFP